MLSGHQHLRTSDNKESFLFKGYSDSGCLVKVISGLFVSRLEVASSLSFSLKVIYPYQVHIKLGIIILFCMHLGNAHCLVL